jgi:hypothetical protein
LDAGKISQNIHVTGGFLTDFSWSRQQLSARGFRVKIDTFVALKRVTGRFVRAGI